MRWLQWPPGAIARRNQPSLDCQRMYGDDLIAKQPAPRLKLIASLCHSLRYKGDSSHQNSYVCSCVAGVSVEVKASVPVFVVAST